ncbi:uncharacterized protein [Amphiura filiformis]|uniref:uncharacterized protein n=1 Tax=Amphiura filiformis TaxID=82378 RepID=UPI003B213FB5
MIKFHLLNSVIFGCIVTANSIYTCTNVTSLDPQTKQISIDGMVCDFPAIQHTRLQQMTYLYIICSSTTDGLHVGSYLRDDLEAPSILQELKIDGCQGLQIQENDLDDLTSLRILTIQNAYSATYFAPHAFRNLHNLEFLKLRELNLESFPEVLIYNSNNSQFPVGIDNNTDAPLFPHLKRLFLSDNHISTVPSYAFINVPNLEVLDLCSNHLAELKTEAFQPLANLKTLNISNNIFTEITQHFWDNFPSLENLVISHSLMTLFNNLTFDGLSTLLHLEVDSGQLAVIEPNAFQGIPHAEEIIINTEFMKSVPDDLFHGMNSLRKVRLNGALYPISLPLHSLFLNLPNLESITAQRNQITTLANMTSAGSRRHIKLFNFGVNRITAIPVDFFSNEMPKIEVINLHKNMLTSISSYTFSHLSSLQNIDLSDNHLAYIASQAFNNLPMLHYLNLKQNFLSHIQNSAFYKVEHLNSLDLSFNRFTYFQTLGVNHVANGNNDDEAAVTVIMTQNPLQCDCLMYKLLFPTKDELFPDLVVESWPHSSLLANQRLKNYEQLLCSIPGNILVQSNYPQCSWSLWGLCVNIASLTHDDFFCARNSYCPYPCQCYQQADTLANITLCDNKNLTRVPNDLPHDTTELHLEANHIYKLQPGGFTNMPNLLQLGLWSNGISNIPSGVFSGLNKLSVLDKRNNTITSLQPGSFADLSNLEILKLDDNKLRTIPEGVFDGMPSLKTATLQHNPLQCNCSLLWLKAWLQEMSKNNSMDVSNINCTTPQNLTGAVAFFEDEDFMCPTRQRVATIIAVCLAVLLVVALSIIVTIRFKLEIQVLLYSYFDFRHTLQKDEEEDKVYDVFISYSSDDYQYVVFELLKKLEDRVPPYKACIHQRDFLVGEAIANNIVNAIESCKRIIVVLSNNYLDSEWCLYEFKVAHSQFLREHKNRIIVVCMEEVAKDKMDRDMQTFVSMNTYLERHDPLFWKRLLYALPNPREGTIEMIDQVVDNMMQMNVAAMEIGNEENDDEVDLIQQ